VELEVLKILYYSGRASPSGVAKARGTYVSTVDRVLRDLLRRKIVYEKGTDRQTCPSSILRQGRVLYGLTRPGRDRTAIALRLAYSLPRPLLIEDALTRREFRNVRKWLSESRNRIKASAARASIDERRLRYSRQIGTFAQDRVYGCIRKATRGKAVLELVGTHESSSDEIDRLADRTDIGLLTKTHVEKMLKEHDRTVKDLIALDVYVEGAPVFLSTNPETHLKYAAYQAGSTQRGLLAKRVSKKMKPAAVEHQEDLNLGHLEGGYGRIVTQSPLDTIFSLEFRESVDSVNPAPASHETYFLVSDRSCLENRNLHLLVRSGLDRLHQSIADPGRGYDIASHYISTVMHSDLAPLRPKSAVISGLSRIS